MNSLFIYVVEIFKRNSRFFSWCHKTFATLETLNEKKMIIVSDISNKQSLNTEGEYWI